MKYLVDQEGKYLGGYDVGEVCPSYYAIVPCPPSSIKQLWNFNEGQWDEIILESIHDICPIITGGLLKLYHGLGYVPTTVNYYLVCQTAELGYAAGQIVLAKVGALSGKSGIGPAMAISVDSEYLYVRYCSAAPCFNVCRWDTGAQQDICNANWNIKFSVS